MASKRDSWGSNFGFIMAAAGSAVGLGNIWRFPYVTGQNGGGAFVLVYVLCVLLIGAPLVLNEIALGRLSQKNPIGAFKVTKSGPFWMLGAILSVCVSFFILTYYSVIAGWTFGYIYDSLFSANLDFDVFIANPYASLILAALFLVITALIVRGGISKGIEKASKLLMPILFVLIFLMIFRSITLDGAMKGVEYYLKPDFSKIKANSVLAAIGQAFFSLSIGWGIMITYGSYLPKNQNILSSGLWVSLTDSLVALMAGLIIFPAVFAFGQEPTAGTTLVFKVLPQIFEQLPFGGNIIGTMFFLLLAIAALTSSISILEVPVSYLIDDLKIKRIKAIWIITILVFIVGIPSALSNGADSFFTNMEVNIFGNEVKGFLNIFDFIIGNFILVIACLMVCVYTIWVYGRTKMIEELSQGSTFFTKPFLGTLSMAKIWLFLIKFLCPTVIIMVLLNLMGVF